MSWRDIRFHRSLWSYSKIQRAVSWLLRNRQLQLARLRPRDYLNLGCGPNLVEGFVNVDAEWKPGLDLCWDFRQGLPFRAAAFTGIFAEHCVEHLTYNETRRLLAECRRCLRPGGRLRVVVPDAERYLTAYVQAKTGPAAWPYESPDADRTALMVAGRIFLDHGHRSAYDAETLTRLLAQAGFHGACRESYRRGTDPRLLQDSAGRAAESLYVEAEP